MFHEWRREGYLVSTDPGRLNLGVIHSFLKGSYWARGVPLEVVGRPVENSLCFGLYRGEEQVGFARVVTDPLTGQPSPIWQTCSSWRATGAGASASG